MTLDNIVADFEFLDDWEDLYFNSLLVKERSKETL